MQYIYLINLLKNKIMNLKYQIQEGFVSVVDLDRDAEIIAGIEINKAEDGDRVLALIENAYVEENYQRQGIYAKMLKAYADIFFDDNTFFASIGRSDNAAQFWAKTLNISLEDTELGIEKDQQERMLVIDFELELVSNEYAPDFFQLFW